MQSLGGRGQEVDFRVRAQLERVLESELFTRAEQLSRFLRFIVERHLEGRNEELKESVIGVEVFGRKPDYNPKYDPIVRTEARRLRARLGQYYTNGGGSDPLVIELPKGGYVPIVTEVLGESNTESKTLTESRNSAEEISRGARKANLAVIVASVCLAAVLAAVGGWWEVQHRNTPIPIAVLPLINLSQDPANDYFSDGLTGEIIRNLSIIDGMTVRSQTSSFVFKGKPRNIRDAGQQLSVDYILEGSVLRAGSKLRINAQLVRVRDDVPLWSEKYDRELRDIFAIQDEISRGIVNSLRLKLGRGQRRYQTSPEAYDLYLRARAPWVQQGWSVIGKAVGPLEAVIAQDPSFAPAWADLAVAYGVRSGGFKPEFADALPKMRSAAEKAMQLDPLLAEAQDAMAIARSRDARWEESEKCFRRAVELDPHNPMYYGHYVMYLLLPVGRIEEALEQLRIGERADPLSYEIHFDAAYVLFAAGRYEEAARHCGKLPADAHDRTFCRDQLLLKEPRIDEAIRTLELAFRNAPSWRIRSDLAYAYALASRREDAEKLVASILDPFEHARVYAGLRDTERTLQALDEAAVAGPFRMGRTLAFPEFAFLRGDPRLKALRKKVGLPG
jgi:serine/threonine-protein kinase